VEVVVRVEVGVVGLTKVGLMNVGEGVMIVSIIAVIAGGGVSVGDGDDVWLVFGSDRKVILEH
jgi:hypothetical protein